MSTDPWKEEEEDNLRYEGIFRKKTQIANGNTHDYAKLQGLGVDSPPCIPYIEHVYGLFLIP
jgi:hypothetical protein